MKKGSKAAKAWGAKMKRARNQKKKPKKRKKSKSTRKGQKRKTVSKRRAYEGLTVRVRKKGSKRKPKRTDSDWNF